MGKQVIEDSLEGFIHDSNRVMLAQYRDEPNLFELHKSNCLSKMEAICKEYYQQEMEHLMIIPGIKVQAATTLIAETGANMEIFLTASAIAG